MSAQTTHTVTTVADAGDGSLREAIAAAAGRDIIRFVAALLGQTITLGGTEPHSHVGVNLIGGDPGLAPLGDYGGPTRTMPPVAGSPAVDQATSGLPFDQRGFTRAKDGDRNGEALFDVRAVGVGPPWLVNTAADQSDGSVGDGLSLREALADTPPLPDPEEQRVLFDLGAVEAVPSILPPEIDTDDDDSIDDRLEPLYPQFAVGVNDLTVDSDTDQAPDWEEIHSHADPYNDNS